MNKNNSMLARVVIGACLALGAVFFWQPAARAQSSPQREESVTIDVPKEMFIAEAHQLRVIVRGSMSTNQPTMPEVPGASIEYRGVNSSTGMTIIINGRVQTSGGEVGHFYSITPKRAGKLTIPPISVDLGGRTIRSDATVVNVREVPLAPDFPITVTVPQKTVYVGQPLPVLLEWRLGRNVNAPGATLPISGARHDVFPDSRIASAPTSTQAEMRLDGDRTTVMFSSGAISIERIIVPREAGVITIGPARVDFGAAAGQRAPNVMDMPGADRTIYERVYSQAEPVRITVIDLPTEGRPPNFSGLVGNYSIIASADAQTVGVGDPINLSVRITGPQPLSLVPALDLARSMSGSAEFRVSREPILPEIIGTAAAFRTVIRPRSSSASQIGPISLSYFDPVKRRYESTTSAPIPLKVTPSNTIALPEEPATTTQPSPIDPVDRISPDGLPDIWRDAGPSMGASAWSTPPNWRSPWGAAALLTLPAACVLLAGVQYLRWQRDKNPTTRRRKAAMRVLRRQLHRGTEPAHALAGFVADWFDKPRTALTAAEARELLARVDDPVASQLASLLDRIDEPRFALAPTPNARPSPAEIVAAASNFARVALRRPTQETA